MRILNYLMFLSRWSLVETPVLPRGVDAHVGQVVDAVIQAVDHRTHIGSGQVDVVDHLIEQVDGLIGLFNRRDVDQGVFFVHVGRDQAGEGAIFAKVGHVDGGALQIPRTHLKAELTTGVAAVAAGLKAQRSEVRGGVIAIDAGLNGERDL